MKKKLLLLATSNKHKLREIRHILGKRYEVRGMRVKVKEDKKTFEGNALKKARAVAKRYQALALADDSGLMVNCLNGRPGVRSARYASPPTAKNLCGKLLKEINGKINRSARFICAMAVVHPSGKYRSVKGICPGRIIKEMKGSHGFGYDPVFVPKGYKKTFAQMKPALKNKLSHRARALRKAKKLLLGLSWG